MNAYPIDGFRSDQHQAFTSYSDAAAARFYESIGSLRRRFQVDVQGLEHIPRGRALIVANHAFGWDVVFPMEAIWREVHRPTWALGEHLWWKIPFVRRLAAAVGTVDGTPENVDRLLQKDQLVVVLPGGLREAVKPRELRYRLLWGHRYGFVKAAIRNQAPIVPLAGIGFDELFDFVGDAYKRGQKWAPWIHVPIPLPSRILPIPHRVAWRYVFGEPIAPPPVESGDDPVAVRRFRREVEGALHELLDEELARRAGISLG